MLQHRPSLRSPLLLFVLGRGRNGCLGYLFEFTV